MRKIIFILLLLNSYVPGISQTEIPETCLIKGKVINRNSTVLYLYKELEDLRVQSVKIPITDGKFEYLIKDVYFENYSLAFKDELMSGSWRPIEFIPDNTEIIFELYSKEEFHKNKIIDSPLSQLIFDLNSKYAEIMKPLTDLYPKMDSTRKAGGDSRELMKKIDSLQQKIMLKADAHNLSVIKKEKNIVGLSQLYKLIRSSKYISSNNYDQYVKELANFKLLFPESRYISRIEALIHANNIKVGAQYIPFSAPDKDGNLVNIASIIESNELTLIDLWAPW